MSVSTIPANAGIYWVGEAVQDVNYVDFDKIPDKVREMIEMVSNAAHLARLLAVYYPGVS